MGAMYQGRQMNKQKNSRQGVFSFMESTSIKRAPQRKRHWMEVRGTRGKPSQGVHWLDAMLGSGSYARARHSARQVLENNTRLTRPVRPRGRVKPSAKASAKKSGRGWIRLGLVSGLILWSLSVVRPVDRIQKMIKNWNTANQGKTVAEVSEPREARNDGEAQAAIPRKIEMAKLTPVIPGLTSGPVALWKGHSGVWYQVDIDGNLNKSAPPQSEENLGLPILTGLGTRKVADGDRLVLRLDSDRKLLSRLFPLQRDLAPEIEKVEMHDPRNPILVTFDGVQALLGEGEYQTKQARLAMVLNDSAAKKRRVATVDMRYSNGAVVKLK